MNSDRTNKLYNYLVEIGAENRSEEVFTNDIYNPERREKLYNYLVEIGAENRPLEAFDNDLGFSQVDTPTNEGPDAIIKAPKGGSAYEAFKRNMIPLSVEQKPQVATVLPKYEAEPKAEEAPQTLEQMMGELGGNINKLNKTIEGIENIPQTTMEAWEEMHPTDLGVMNNPISTGDEYIFQNIESGNIGQREYAFLKGQRENAVGRVDTILSEAKRMVAENPDKYYTVVKMDTGHGLQEQLMPTNEGATLLNVIDKLEETKRHYNRVVSNADKKHRFGKKKNAVGEWVDENLNIPNIFKGLGEIDIINTLSMGWKDTLRDLNLAAISEKANRREVLTPEENLYLKLADEEKVLADILNAEGGPTSGYKRGKNVADTLPYLVGIGSTSAISTPIKAGAKGVVKEAANKSFKQFAAKSLNKVIGAAEAAAATIPLQSNILNNYARNTLNDWLEDGDIQSSKTKRVWNATADAFADVFTEHLGGVLTQSAKYVMPKIGIEAVLANRTGFGKTVAEKFLRDGFIGEVEEEFWAGILSPVLRGESIGKIKEEYKELFSKENIWDIIGTTAVMSAGFGVIQAADATITVGQYTNARQKAKRSLAKIQVEDLRQAVYDAMQLPTMQETAEALSQIKWRQHDKPDIGYAMEYVYNTFKKRVMEGAITAEEANKAIGAEMASIEAVQQGGMVQTSIVDGQPVYVLGDVKANDPNAPVVVLRMDGSREQVPVNALGEITTTPISDVVAELFSNKVAEVQQREVVESKMQDDQDAREAGVVPTVDKQVTGTPSFEEGQIVVVNGEEGEITALDPYTRTARVQVGGNNISVSFDEMQPSAMDEGLQMDEQTAEVEGAEVAPTTEQEATFEEAPVEHSSEQETPTPLQPTAEATPQPIQPIRNAEGKVDYQAMGEEQSASYINQTLGDRAVGWVDEQIKNRQKKLEKVEKNTNLPLDIDEAQKAIEAQKAQIEQIKAEIAMWEGIKNRLTTPTQEAVAEETAPTETAVEGTTPTAEEVTPENVESTPEVAEQEITPTDPDIAEEVSVEEATPTVEANEQVEVDDIPEVEATPEQTATIPAEEVKWEAGLVQNEFAKKHKLADVWDKIAKALGVRLEITDDIEQDGEYNPLTKTIKVAYTNRSKGLAFIVGHEFLHRMQDMSSEAYQQYKDSVIEFYGKDVFNRKCRAMNNAYWRFLTNEKFRELKSAYQKAFEGGEIEKMPTDKDIKREVSDKYVGEIVRRMPTREVIEEEVIADFSGAITSQFSTFKRFVDRNKSDNKLLRSIRNSLDHINRFFEGRKHHVKSTAMRCINYLDELINTAAFEAGKEDGQATPNQGEALNALRDENDINIDIIEGENGNIEAITDTAKGQGLFSLRTYEEGGRQALSDFLDQRVANGALATTEAQDMLSQMDDIYRICNEMKSSYAPFGAWSEAKVVIDSKGNPVFSVIKQNGEYVMNLDFSLVCKKRRTLDAVLNEMVRRGMIEEIPNDNTTIAKINNVIRNYGFETACALCFVDARRFQVLNTAKQFTDLWNTIVRSAVPIGTELGYFDFANGGVSEGVAVELNTDSLTKMSDGRSVAARIAKHLLNNPNDARLLRPRDFVSTAGFDNVKAQNPAIMSLYNSKKGTGGPKAAFSDVQYLNDILNTKWQEEYAFAIGGVRLQSFSDYVPRMVFDYIQMIADLAAKGLPVHAYTKESLFAKTFGLTGMKINLSLVPDVVEGGVAAGLDADGNYVWKQGETFPYEEAIAIQNAEGYKENCGTIAVGVSDAHILKMLDDENIRMVIPYHKSGLPKVVAKMNNVAGFTDYTNAGKEKHKSGKALTKEEAKEIPNFNELLREYNDPRRAAQAFLEWCESKNYTPRFAKFANHPNYYKVLEDFTTLVEGEYVPQEAVKFNFPTEGDAFGSLASLIEQGLEEDAILEGQRDEKVGAIVEEVGEVLGTPLYSLRDNTPFYSNAEYAVRGIKQEKATPEQWLKMIEKNGGLKAGEDKWLGLSDWLKESKAKTLTKQEVLDYINANKIVVEDVEYGVQDYMSENEIYGSDEYRALEESLLEYEDETPYIDKEKFKELRNKDEDFVDGFDVDYWGEQLLVKNPFAAARYLGISNVGKRINNTRLEYTTNGLTNKREIALVVPTIEPWNAEDDIHFGDAGEGRAVAWVRFGETTDEAGNRVLVIDEIQSKRHQEGRERGYRTSDIDKYLKDNNVEVKETGEFYEFYKNGELDKRFSRGLLHYDINKAKNLYVGGYQKSDIPDAPFDKNWHEVAMKRILRYAAENGYDKVAWTTGNQQAERYSIGGVVESIDKQDSYNADEQSFKVTLKATESPLYLTTNNEGVVVNTLAQDYMGKNLSDIFGKEIAVKMLGAKENSTISGDGLRIGGEGMRAFYDQILPNFMNKYGKKWGVKVGEVTMPNLAENNTMHSVDITPAMRESVMQGQPLFSLRGYTDSFKALAEEYNALDKNNAEALADFRARKRNLVEEYWNAMTDELGLPCEFILVDSTIGREALFPIYNVIKPVYEAKFNEPLTFDDFVEEWENDVNYAASYVDGGNIIVGDVVKFDDYNSQDVMTQLFIHENIHHFIDNYITPRELKRLWREVALTSLGRRVRETYPDDDAAKLANEYLAYLIAGVNETDIEPLLDFIKSEGNVSLNDLLSSYGKILPLRGRYATIILKTLRNGYEEREESRNEEGEEVGENNEPARQVEANNDSRGWLEENLRGGQEEVDVVEFDETPLYSLRDLEDELDYHSLSTKAKVSRAFTKAIQDNMVDVKKLQDALKEAGVDINDFNNAYNAFDTVSSKAEYKYGKYFDEYVVPFLEFLVNLQQQYGVTYDEVCDYLLAKHSIERHDSGLNALNPNDDAPWGRKKVAKIIKDFESKVGARDLVRLWQQIRSINNRNLDILVEYGIKTPADIEMIKSHKWKYYVPLKGWDMEAEDFVDPNKHYDLEASNRSANIKGKWMEKDAKGRSSKPSSPLPHMLYSGNKAILFGEMNKAKKVLYELLQDANATLGDVVKDQWNFSEVYYVRTAPDVWEERKATDIPVEELDEYKKERIQIAKLAQERRKLKRQYAKTKSKEVRERIEKLNEEIRQRSAKLNITTENPKAYHPNERVYVGQRNFEQNRQVPVYVNGQLITIAFTNPRYSNAINKVSEVKMRTNNAALNKVVDVQKWLTRTASKLSTTYNPNFIATNFLRDLGFSAYVHLVDAKHGNFKSYLYALALMSGAIRRGLNGSANPLTAKELEGRNLLSRADRALLIDDYGEERVNDTLFQWYVENGAPMGFSFLKDTDRTAKDIRKQMRRMKGKYNVSQWLINVFPKLAELFERVSQNVELANRFATFIASIDKGESVGQAVANSRNFTVNFNKKGDLTPVAGTFFAFFNPTIQGIAQFLGVSAKNWKRAVPVLTAIATLGYLWTMLLDEGWWNDEDGDDELTNTKVPSWLKRGYWVWPLNRKNGSVIRVPLAQQLRTIWALGSALRDLHAGRIDAKQFGEEMLDSFLSDFTYGFTEGGGLVRAITPTAYQVWGDLGRNKDAFGRPIYREVYGDQVLPDSQMGARNVNEGWKNIAEGLNALTGGNEFDKGWADINPSKLQYVVEQTFGGLGTFARRLKELIDSVATDRVEFELQNIPLISSLVYTVKPDSGYEDYNKLKVEFSSKSAKKQEGKKAKGYIDEKAKDLYDDKREWFNKFKKDIDDLADLRDQYEKYSDEYDVVDTEIRRIRNLVGRVFKEVDWSAWSTDDELDDAVLLVMDKYSPNYEERITQIFTEYAKEN